MRNGREVTGEIETGGSGEILAGNREDGAQLLSAYLC